MKAIKFRQFGLAIALCALAANPLAASPIWVTNTNDSGAGSLRAAIITANTAGGGEIEFSITNTITLLSALPSLTNINITGPGTNLITISGGNQVRVLSMDSGTTNTLSGLTIANGMAQGYLSNGEYEVFTYASGISNAGSLKLLSCVVQNCTNELSYGVGIYNAGDMDMEASVVADCDGTDGMGAYGGGIYNGGTLRMTNCRVSRCNSEWPLGMCGGILNEGTLTMNASVIESCWSGGEVDGGGILNEGTAVLCGCTVSNCYGFWGGGIESYGNLAITNSTIVDNECNDVGGGLNIGSGTNWLVGCTITGNSGGIVGGGIRNGADLRMLNCTVSGNSGGGIANGDFDLAGVTDQTIYANHCTIVSNTVGSDHRGAGGVYNEGVFDCRNSIIADNGTNDFSGVLISRGRQPDSMHERLHDNEQSDGQYLWR